MRGDVGFLVVFGVRTVLRTFSGNLFSQLCIELERDLMGKLSLCSFVACALFLPVSLTHILDLELCFLPVPLSKSLLVEKCFACFFGVPGNLV